MMGENYKLTHICTGLPSYDCFVVYLQPKVATLTPWNNTIFEKEILCWADNADKFLNQVCLVS